MIIAIKLMKLEIDFVSHDARERTPMKRRKFGQSGESVVSAIWKINTESQAFANFPSQKLQQGQHSSRTMNHHHIFSPNTIAFSGGRCVPAHFRILSLCQMTVWNNLTSSEGFGWCEGYEGYFLILISFISFWTRVIVHFYIFSSLISSSINENGI